MEYREEDLLGAIKESFLQYLEFGERSTKKLKPLHGYIGKIAQSIWGEDFEYNYISNEVFEETYIAHGQSKTRTIRQKEKKVKGKYYNKTIDICVTDKGKPVCCIGVKFVTSNFKQNANNYFEQMMGKAANIQRISIPYYQIVIFRDPIPYFKKDRSVLRLEYIQQYHIMSLIDICCNVSLALKPIIGVILVDIDEETGNASKVSESQYLSKDLMGALYGSNSIESLVKKIVKCKQFYDWQQKYSQLC
ncbi:hypothetical protein BN938_2271 [Mucinivorans hirudinis]|uniref:Restriction endonuclease n=1 Tax=Mucinivorans hirudinis TaxID=1433126 RepID=A0A060RDN2_9BACT|nr:hypothetical protein BN938_2271 [Mucinivorans hirudinis]